MKAPLSWLREYVPIELDPLELASRLAMTGTEVERVDMVGLSDEDGNLTHFVVGKVLELRTAPQRRQALRLPGRRGRTGAPDHRVRRPQRGGGTDRPGGAPRRPVPRWDGDQGGEAARDRVVRHDHVRGGAGLRGQERGHPRASPRMAGGRGADGAPARERGGAGGRGHAQPAGLPLHPRAGPRGGGGHPGPLRRTLHLQLPHGRAAGGGGHRGGGAGPGPLPALRRPRHPGSAYRRVPALVEGAHRPRGHAAGQQRGGRHQLRDVGVGPAAPRLRSGHAWPGGGSSSAGLGRANPSPPWTAPPAP